MKPIIRTHIGVTLDGFMATADGWPAWEVTGTFSHGGDSHGYAEFSQKCEGVIVGGITCAQGLTEGPEDWPWPDKKVFVLTSKPLPEHTPAGVVASASVEGLVKQMEEAGLGGVQLLGGPKTVRAFFEQDAIDEFGLVVLPVLIGKGLPLFDAQAAEFSWPAWRAALADSGGMRRGTGLKLLSHEAFPDGSVHLVYSKVVY